MQGNFISNQCKAYHPPTIANYTFWIYLMLLRGKTNTCDLNLALWSTWGFLINGVPSIQFPRRHLTMKFHVLQNFLQNYRNIMVTTSLLLQIVVLYTAPSLLFLVFQVSPLCNQQNLKVQQRQRKKNFPSILDGGLNWISRSGKSQAILEVAPF